MGKRHLANGVLEYRRRCAATARAPLEVALLRVPFFLEPDYDESENFSISNLERLRRKWGGKAAFEAQKDRHGLKERGREVGIEKFMLEREASNTMRSHRLVQFVSRTRSLALAEALYTELNTAHFVLGKKLNDSIMLATDIRVALTNEYRNLSPHEEAAAV